MKTSQKYNLLWECIIITLSDFFKLLDSFWIACKILIPYWMLPELQYGITTV